MRELHVMLSHYFLDDQVQNAAGHHLERNRSRDLESQDQGLNNLPFLDTYNHLPCQTLYTRAYTKYTDGLVTVRALSLVQGISDWYIPHDNILCYCVEPRMGEDQLEDLAMKKS